MFDKGMSLRYQAGSKDKYYIQPGYYRFVHFHRQAQTITYSDVYQITDKNGIYTGPGSSVDSVVSYTLNRDYTMYNGTEITDGRTLVKSNGAITLKNCTAKYIYGSKYLYSLCYDGEIYKYRIRVTANVGGTEAIISAEKSFTYTPTGPVLTGLWLNGKKLSIAAV